MAYIYKITNNINDKVYIGKTLDTIENRWKKHKQDSKKRGEEKRPLYNAMNKYGSNNFQIELIEECDDNLASEREIYWIKYFNSYYYGYNATQGGEGKAIYDRDKILEELKVNPSPIEISRKFGCSTDTVRKIAKQNNIKTINIGQFTNCKTVYQYDKDNNLLNIFTSTADASRWCCDNKKTKSPASKARTHIGECARNIRKSAYGYIWRYEPI